ncbi:DsbA family oxidoreductase [Nocardia sp. NPDC057227]|uniref:DsbA family oxidoreductase n=1 Tax=Nocardia sp. NPDC057227 TaxID=3346056 RepID=UPI00362D6527
MDEIAVDFWFDFLCPWCYIGKRRLDLALAEFEGAAAVRLRYRSFDLHPGEPKDAELTIPQRLQRDVGLTRERAEAAVEEVDLLAAELGLSYRMRDALLVNSFDAHRLYRFAADRNRGEEMRERLMLAYTGEGANIADHPTLVRLGTDAGLAEADVRALLAGDDYAVPVHSDHGRSREIGIRGVPTVVIDGGPGISGAQPPQVYLRALRAALSAGAR